MKGLVTLIVTVGVFWLPVIAVCQEAAFSDRDWDLGMWVAVATGEENTNSFAEAQILGAGPFVGRIIRKGRPGLAGRKSQICIFCQPSLYSNAATNFVRHLLRADYSPVEFGA